MASQRLEMALRSARRALAALTEGDTGAFEQLWLEHEGACQALAGLPAVATAADHQALDELIALDLRVASAIEAVLADTTERMAVLRRGGRTNAAYAASSRFA
jgi:hypothetical protein